MADKLFADAGKTEASGNPATPGAQPNQPEAGTATNQTNSGPSNVTPPATKEQGKGDPSQTTQSPEDGKAPPSALGSAATPEPEEDKPVVTRLQSLKKKADMMGISYSNNISEETLAARIDEKLNGPLDASQTISPNALENPLGVEPTPTTQPLTLRQKMQQEKMALVRIRVTNLDPRKSDLPGEVITVANKFLGTVRKYVPFGEHSENGYHVPVCIYEFLKDRQFLSIRTRKGRNGVNVVEQTYAREFAIEVLPPLTPEEIAKLAAAQTARGQLD